MKFKTFVVVFFQFLNPAARFRTETVFILIICILIQPFVQFFLEFFLQFCNQIGFYFNFAIKISNKFSIEVPVKFASNL